MKKIISILLAAAMVLANAARTCVCCSGLAQRRIGLRLRISGSMSLSAKYWAA